MPSKALASACSPTPTPSQSESKTFQLSPHHVPPQKEGGLGPWLRIASVFSPKTTSEAPQDFCSTYVQLKSTSTSAEPIGWSAALGYCPTGQGSCCCCHPMNPTHPLTCLCCHKKGPVLVHW